MYKIVLDRGEVIRTTDNKVVSPAQDINDSDFQAYLVWLQTNEPIIVDTEEDKVLLEALRIREQKKIERKIAVDNIIVTTSTGKSFNGDEVAQTRMSRALQILSIAGVNATIWVLADNTPTEVTFNELAEALLLSAQEQSRLWII